MWLVGVLKLEVWNVQSMQCCKYDVVNVAYRIAFVYSNISYFILIRTLRKNCMLIYTL